MRNKITSRDDRLMRQFSLPMVFLFPFIALDVGTGWMMGGEHMMDWWGIPFMGFMMIGIWIVFIVIAFLVYQDAKKRGLNGLLWLLLVILPWIGIVFLVVYLVIREEKTLQQSSSEKSAEQIVDARYAKGEITREEYQQKKNDLVKEK